MNPFDKLIFDLYSARAKQFPVGSGLYNGYMGIALHPQFINLPSVQGFIVQNANEQPPIAPSGQAPAVTGTTDGAAGSNQPGLNPGE
jgi:hypothetical protein